MANKQQIRKNMHRLERVRTWQLVVVLLLASFLSATFLRLNNIGMVERRAAVLAADESNNEYAVHQRLYDLQRYVTSHMNTNMGRGIYLEHQYRRDSRTAIEAASSTTNPNGNIYQKAQEVCAPQFTSYSQAYLQCTLTELEKYPGATGPTGEIKLPHPETYRHTFVSPIWSPDFAGFSVIACAVIVLMIIARLVSLGILRLLLKSRHLSI